MRWWDRRLGNRWAHDPRDQGPARPRGPGDNPGSRPTVRESRRGTRTRPLRHRPEPHLDRNLGRRRLRHHPRTARRLDPQRRAHQRRRHRSPRPDLQPARYAAPPTRRRHPRVAGAGRAEKPEGRRGFDAHRHVRGRQDGDDPGGQGPGDRPRVPPDPRRRQPPGLGAHPRRLGPGDLPPLRHPGQLRCSQGQSDRRGERHRVHHRHRQLVLRDRCRRTRHLRRGQRGRARRLHHRRHRFVLQRQPPLARPARRPPQGPPVEPLGSASSTRVSPETASSWRAAGPAHWPASTPTSSPAPACAW